MNSSQRPSLAASAAAVIRLLGLMSILPALTIGVVTAQVPSPPRQAVQQQAAAADANVKRCIYLATRRQEPKLDVTTTVLEQALMLFELTPVFDGLAACRAAEAAFPGERRVIIGHTNAADAMAILLFGFKDQPKDDEEAFAKVLAMAPGTEAPPDNFMGRAVLFFLASAAEYGVGTRVDKAQAAIWYRKAAAAGERVSMRELSRLLMMGDGIAADKAEAAHWLLAAVKAGDPDLRRSLVEERGAAYDEAMRLALEQELVKMGVFKGAPTGAFDAATTAAIAALATK